MAIIGVVERAPGKIGRLGPKLHDAYESLATLVSPKNLVVPTDYLQGKIPGLLISGNGTSYTIQGNRQLSFSLMPPVRPSSWRYMP